MAFNTTEGWHRTIATTIDIADAMATATTATAANVTINAPVDNATRRARDMARDQRTLQKYACRELIVIGIPQSLEPRENSSHFV